MSATATFPALGSTAVVITAEADLPEACAAVAAVTDEFDAACSRFREDSELMTLERAAGRPILVSRTLLDALQVAVRAAVLTDGDVDPTLGAALVDLGYDRDFAAGLGDESGRTQRHDDSATAGRRRAPSLPRLGAVPGWRTIRISPEASTVTVPRGIQLDLGATAKALASDRAAAAASRATGGAGVLVALGGDIAVSGVAPEGGWRVRVTDDHRAGVEAPGQWVTVLDGGLATSSTVVRRWHHKGEQVHHLLDPSSRRPVSGGWRTVSVAARSCVDANIATTAAIVRGRRAPEWLESLGLPSRLVSDSGDSLHLAGWPSAGDDLTPVRTGGMVA
ncbi:MAG TPA: FAD:protein FMN transferase [Solirubrobacteraceae bacterium]